MVCTIADQYLRWFSGVFGSFSDNLRAEVLSAVLHEQRLDSPVNVVYQRQRFVVDTHGAVLSKGQQQPCNKCVRGPSLRRRFCTASY